MIPICFLIASFWQDLPPISAATDYARLHEGVNPPKLLHSVDPDYTPLALAANISGTVVLQAVIDVHGYVAFASVLSPLPAGLDAQALAAVKHWRYTPAVMDNEVIPLLTTIDVLFRLPYKTPRPSPNFTGGAALFAQGKDELPKDPAQGWRLIASAAFLGSAEAQFSMGDKRERDGDRTQAKRYFRLCAASAHANCQYRLGRLLVDGPDVNPNDFTQGVAWLELANEKHDREAAALYEKCKAMLSSLQLEWVAQLKPHMELKKFHGF
jgi:TonB family protein